VVREFKAGRDGTLISKARWRAGCCTVSGRSRVKRVWRDDTWFLPGMPDFIVYNRARKELCFVEVKGPKAKLRQNQKDMIKKLIRKGVKVFIFRPRETSNLASASFFHDCSD